MTYEEFSSVWSTALRESDLQVQGWPRETFDLQHVERRYEVSVEPVGGQDAPPFYVAALISWRWSALQFARNATSEEDMVRELLGRSRATTQKPWLRIDMKLSATLPYDEPMPMPNTATWKQWMHETMTRLEHVEPMHPKKVARTNRKGDLEILAWQGEPELEAVCNSEGILRLSGVSVSAWQALDLPRRFSDSDRQDPLPYRPLRKMFSRLKAALHAWSEVLDHLRAK